MNKFKTAPRADLAPTEHQTVEDFIATAPVQTVKKPLREWEKYDLSEKPVNSVTFQLRLNRYQRALLAAVAKHHARSSNGEAVYALMRHLLEVEKELP